MHHHRFQDSPASLGQPCPAAPAVTPASFVWVPVPVPPGTLAVQLVMQQWMYQLALEQARAVARPSLPERDLLGVWN